MGKIEIEGNSNLKSKRWQTNLEGNSVNLTPWLSQLQLKGVNLDRPTSIKNAHAQFQGKLDNLDINKTKNISVSQFAPNLPMAGKYNYQQELFNFKTSEPSSIQVNATVTGSLPIFYPVGNLTNPLSLNLSPGKIDIKKLYQGELTGTAILTGTAFSPIISGKVSLADGQVFLPTIKADESTDTIVETIPATEDPPIIFRLDDFQVQLDKLSFQQDPLYRFMVTGNLNLNGSDRQILNSPAISLSSTPARSEGEIMGLLGNRLIGFAEKIQNASSEELFNIGATQFVIAPLQRRLFSKVDDVIINTGKEIGLDYLRVFPFVEGVYEIDRDSSVRATYNYPINLVNFINGDENFTNNGNEVKVEYQLRF